MIKKTASLETKLYFILVYGLIGFPMIALGFLYQVGKEAFFTGRYHALKLFIDNIEGRGKDL